MAEALRSIEVHREREAAVKTNGRAGGSALKQTVALSLCRGVCQFHSRPGPRKLFYESRPSNKPSANRSETKGPAPDFYVKATQRPGNFRVAPAQRHHAAAAPQRAFKLDPEIQMFVKDQDGSFFEESRLEEVRCVLDREVSMRPFNVDALALDKDLILKAEAGQPRNGKSSD